MKSVFYLFSGQESFLVVSSRAFFCLSLLPFPTDFPRHHWLYWGSIRPFLHFQASITFYLCQKRGASTEALSPILPSPSCCDVAHGQTCHGVNCTTLTAPTQEHVGFLTLLPHANPLRFYHGHKIPTLCCFSFVSTIIATISLSYHFTLETET